MKFLISFIVLITISLWGYGQKEFHFKHLTSENGLSNNNCTAIVQDQSGFIWIGTANGLNRYDGNSFKIYQHNEKDTNSLSNNNIRALAIDAGGKIWIGTAEGLNCFDPKTDTFRRFYHSAANPKTLSSDRISALHCSKSNQLWIGTDIGLNRFNPENFRNERIISSLLTRSNTYATDVNSIAEDAGGSIWIGMWWGGLKRIDPQTLAVNSFFAEPDSSDGMTNDNVLGVYCDRENNIWASNFRGGISCYSVGQGVFLKKPRLPENSDPGTIEQDLSGKLWIKDTPGSLMIFDPVKQSFNFLHSDLGNLSGISTGYISAIFCDKSGMVWLATDKGITYYDPRGQLFTKYLYQLNLGKRAYCNSFFDDGGGHLWIAVYDVGLVRYDLKTGAKKIYTDAPGNPYSINHKTVNGIAADASGDIWLATNNGICVIDRLTGRINNRLFYNRDNNPDIVNGISARTTSWQSRFFWGVEGGIYDVENQKNWLLSEDGRISVNQLKINCVTADRKGDLWIGTEFLGLKYFKTSTGQISDFVNVPGDSTSICSNTVNDIFEAKNGTLWISTPNGLSRFDAQTGKFSNYSQREGLSANDCFSAREDAAGNIWILTSLGLDKYNPNTGSFTNYDSVDGLSLNLKGLYQSPSGDLYGGHSEDGFYRFPPDSIPAIKGHSKVVFTDFFISNKPVRVDTAGVKSPLKKAIQYTNEIVLEHNQNVIGFEFSSLNFSNSGKTRYSCKLDGFDEKWFIVDGKNGRVSYTNLNPGKYVFRVKIAGSNNKVNLPETSVKLTILAPWWASGLAYFCYFTIFGALLFFIRKYFADKQKLKSSFPDHIERNLPGVSIELAPSSPEIPDTERLFLDKLMAITEKHLSDSDFDVSQFALELGMEASVLHRKLKVLINQSPGDFIRTMRMKRAAQLLADKSISISEVASQVGFGNNTNYFSTAFRRHFGKSPKEFQQN